MTLVICPLCDTVSDAIDYLESKGCTVFHLWRGPDGKIRGHGAKEIEIYGPTRYDAR